MSHNVFYSIEDLPLDEQGNPKYPDDFNKIKMYGKTLQDFITAFYNDNIINPYHLVKGSQPTRPDNTRKVIGFLGLIFNGDPLAKYDTIQEKKSILAFKLQYYDTMFGNGNFGVSRVDVKLIENATKDKTYKYNVVYNPIRNLVIDNKFSLDIPTEISVNVDSTVYRNTVIAESSSDDFDFRTAQKIGVTDITSFEELESGSNDDGDTTSLLALATSKLGEYRTKIERSVMIAFKDKTFNIDIKAGDTIQMIGFDNLLDGKYMIHELTEVCENMELKYSIDKMEYLETEAK